MNRRVHVDVILRFLEVKDPGLLRSMRREGLFESDELEPVEADELRVATVLIRELGVNTAGVEVILRMRRRLLSLEQRTAEAIRLLLEKLDER